MVTKETLLQQAKQELVKSLRHLNYSYQKTKSLNLNEAMLEDEETLESFEGLVSRFCRTSDIFISRYLRTHVMIQEPGFRGSLLLLTNEYDLACNMKFRILAEIKG